MFKAHIKCPPKRKEKKKEKRKNLIIPLIL
jgi:hypothetical protein